MTLGTMARTGDGMTPGITADTGEADGTTLGITADIGEAGTIPDIILIMDGMIHIGDTTITTAQSMWKATGTYGTAQEARLAQTGYSPALHQSEAA